MRKMTFKRLHGGAAYLMWYIYNDCQIKIKTYMATDRNLEIITDEEGNIFAYRYDHPQDMVHLVLDDGMWRFTDEGKGLQEDDFNRLRLICRDYSRN